MVELQLLRLSAVAKLLNISKSTAYELAAKGEIPIVRLGARGKRGLLRVPADALRKLIEERTADREGER
jgi:excisionase family DNA binding protein